MLNKIKISLYSNGGLAVLVVLFLIVVFISLFDFDSTKNNNNGGESIITSGNGEVSSSSFLPISEPVKIYIPKININANFEAPLGLNQEGEAEVPNSYDKVGWYKNSPTPGALGPAVVFGHVDSMLGPAVFYSLGQLQTGDDIYIQRNDGTTAHFKVDFFERYEQKEFPTDKVYGNIDHAGLRLVTCSGIYQRGQQRYTHNLVVYATLAE